MKYCPKCQTYYGVYAIKFTTSNHPVEKQTEFNYCPCCGIDLMNIDLNTNMYDTVTQYSNCIVEVLENSLTGECSVGWYKTEDTEEMREQC